MSEAKLYANKIDGLIVDDAFIAFEISKEINEMMKIKEIMRNFLIF